MYISQTILLPMHAVIGIKKCQCDNFKYNRWS